MAPESRIVRMEEMYRDYSPEKDLRMIENWFDAKFTTSEGRTFALFIDPERIFYRLKAAYSMIKEPPTWEGAILETDTDDPAFTP